MKQMYGVGIERGGYGGRSIDVACGLIDISIDENLDRRTLYGNYTVRKYAGTSCSASDVDADAS